MKYLLYPNSQLMGDKFEYVENYHFNGYRLIRATESQYVEIMLTNKKFIYLDRIYLEYKTDADTSEFLEPFDFYRAILNMDIMRDESFVNFNNLNFSNLYTIKNQEKFYDYLKTKHDQPTQDLSFHWL